MNWGGSLVELRDLGFREGINEVIAVTFGVNDSGYGANTAPLGIIVDDDFSNKAKLRLFYTIGKRKTHTMENVERGSKIYANICFDAMAFAVSAFEDLDRSFFSSDFVLKCAHSFCIFEVRKINKKINKSENFWLCELEAIDGRVLNREIRAFNRGFAGVVEAAVHATRYVYSGEKHYLTRVLELKKIIEKCGGSREKEAYSYILKAVNYPSPARD